jgi:predicted esterase
VVLDQNALPVRDHPAVKRLALTMVVAVAVAVVVAAGCTPTLKASLPLPPTDATGCLSLDSGSGLSLPAPADVARLAGAPLPTLSVPPAVPNYFLHVPPSLPTDRPVQLLVAVHGFGGQGPAFAAQFLSAADANQWLLVGPTLTYTSLADPVVTRDEDLQAAQDLVAILADVPQRSGRVISGRVLLVGFSRGGSMAERFALLHPELVQAVAALSGGAYTLPQRCMTQNGTVQRLPLPLGTADLSSFIGNSLNVDAFVPIPFWLSVGADDTQPVPSSYDNALGLTRVDRGAALQQSLTAFGVQSQFTVYPGIGHAVSDEMVRASSTFLAQAAPH